MGPRCPKIAVVAKEGTFGDEAVIRRIGGVVARVETRAGVTEELDGVDGGGGGGGVGVAHTSI